MSEDALGVLRAARQGEKDLLVVDGFHAVKHAIRFDAEVLVVLTDDPEGVAALAEVAAPDVATRLGSQVQVCDRAVLTAAAGRRHPTGIVAVARRPTWRQDPRRRAERSTPALLLEAPRHEGNLGAAIRVAAAAGASGVLVVDPAGRADPDSRGAIRGAAGLQWALPVVSTEADAVEGPLVGLDPSGPPMPLSQVPTDAVLCLGTEREGLSAALRERADILLSLPMRPGVSSLNLATAAAVALYGAATPA